MVEAIKNAKKYPSFDLLVDDLRIDYMKVEMDNEDADFVDAKHSDGKSGFVKIDRVERTATATVLKSTALIIRDNAITERIQSPEVSSFWVK